MKVLAPVLDPPERDDRIKRGDSDRRFFRIEDELWSEAAADIGRDDADRRFFAVQNLRQQTGGDQRRLRRTPQRQPVIDRIAVREQPRPSIDSAQPRCGQNKSLTQMRRAGESGIDIAIRA